MKKTLIVAAGAALALLTLAAPASASPDRPCATVAGTYTQACHDCLNSVLKDPNGKDIVCICGYSGMAGELENNQEIYKICGS